MSRKFIFLFVFLVEAVKSTAQPDLAGINNSQSQAPIRSTGKKDARDSTIIDGEGNRYSVAIMVDGKLWTTTNLNLHTPASYCYASEQLMCNQYGRLYTWKSASQACPLLGEGWRLPTSDEWWRLIFLYGGMYHDSLLDREKAFQILIRSEDSPFKAVLGGGRDSAGHFERLGEHGFYWSSTENDSGSACMINFAAGPRKVYHQEEMEKNSAFSVRCVKTLK